MSILPSFMQTQIAEQAEKAKVIEIPKEYGLDFTTGQPTGQIVEGVEAIKVWIWNCLRTQRFRFPIYSWDYGVDLEQYVGQMLTEEYLDTDMRDEIEEAIKINRYITGIDNYSFERVRSKVTMRFTVNTLLGNIEEKYDVSI